MLPMSTPEVVLTGLLQLIWLWRIFSTFYSSYSISGLVTPESASAWVKSVVTFSVMATSVFLQFIPREEYPRVSLASRLLSIPSQCYSLYFAHKYVGGALDSRRVNIFLYVITFLIILETLYMLSIDWSRIE